MSIEAKLEALTAAVTENTAALNAVLAAGGAPPSNVVPMTPAAEKSAAAPSKPATKQAKTKPAEPAPEPAVEKPTKVEVTEPAADEFSDPLDPETEVVVPASGPAEIDVDATIQSIIDTFKEKMTAAEGDAKAVLKDKFPVLREKWGLGKDDKLISLAPTPEKLVGLLEDIKAL